MVSTGTEAVGFISMTEPCKLVQKAIGRSNATWNSVKQRAVANVGASAHVVCGSTHVHTSDYT